MKKIRACKKGGYWFIIIGLWIFVSLPLPCRGGIFKNKEKVKVPAGMVLIPGGYFIMGVSRKKIYLDKEVGIGVASFPEHKVYLKTYLIDKYEVTVKDYREFVLATGNRPPTLWMWNPLYPQDADNYPVKAISWFDADAYCRFRGKRLPSEAEWEKAARGTSGRIYPWGDTFELKRCNIFEAERGGTLPVTSYKEGASPYGVYNMCGNVMEWTSSWYQAYPGSKLKRNQFGEKYKILRGGAWDSFTRPFASTFYRAYNAPEWAFPSYGVRCVKDVEG